MCICLCICTCVYVYMSTYMRVHVCMSVCIHSHPNAPEPVAASNYVPANERASTASEQATTPCTRASASLRPVAGSIYALAVALTKAWLSAVCASPLPAASSPAPQPCGGDGKILSCRNSRSNQRTCTSMMHTLASPVWAPMQDWGTRPFPSLSSVCRHAGIRVGAPGMTFCRKIRCIHIAANPAALPSPHCATWGLSPMCSHHQDTAWVVDAYTSPGIGEAVKCCGCAGLVLLLPCKVSGRHVPLLLPCGLCVRTAGTNNRLGHSLLARSLCDSTPGTSEPF